MGIDSAVISPYPNNNNGTALNAGIVKTKTELPAVKMRDWNINLGDEIEMETSADI